LEPIDADQARKGLLAEPALGSLIARGAGRSYGDSALADTVVGSRYLDYFRDFDASEGLVSCAAGITLDSLLRFCVPRGWFLPVVPGTRYATVGGAIAADVHGKNHHRDGCFSQFVESFDLLLASGETRRCSPALHPELFRATCGGMGLTGIILEARLRLLPIESAFLEQRTVVADSLEAVFDAFDRHHDSHYSVAWLDCMAGGSGTGRSLLFLGQHSGGVEKGKAALRTHRDARLGIPFSTPAWLLNRITISAFNDLYFRLGKRAKSASRVHYGEFFFPLDGIRHWNRLYGPQGFLQYQFVVPEAAAREAITVVLGRIQRQGLGSFLSVLKKMSAANHNYLSFPLDGYTLALDFKRQAKLFPLLDELDAIVTDHGGRIYLAKDARMSATTFKRGYPHWEAFMAIRQQVDPEGRFGSLQAHRLGLVPPKSSAP
jgi:FAD/FMN-containing dehydrogenase